jgi:hypothetical protein
MFNMYRILKCPELICDFTFLSNVSGKKYFSFLEMRSQKLLLCISVCLQKTTFTEYAREPQPTMYQFTFVPAFPHFFYEFDLS